MPRDSKLQRTYFLTVSIINISTILLLGCVWVFHEYWQYKTEIKQLKSSFIENQKIIIRNEVENAITYIDNINKDTRNELNTALKNRLNEALSIAKAINKGHNSNHSKESLKTLFRTMNNNNPETYIFLINDHEIIDLNTGLFSRYHKQFSHNSFDAKEFVNTINKTRSLNGKLVSFFWTSENGLNKHELVCYVKYCEHCKYTIAAGVNYEEYVHQNQHDVIMRLSHIRYGKNRDGYLFGNKQNADPLFTNGIITMGEPNKWNLTDPFGVKIMQEQNKAAQKPEGDFIKYSWRKIYTPEEKAYGIEKPTSPKTSFIKGYQPWNWMLGAGFYEDETDMVIAQKKENLIHIIKQHLLIIFAGLLFSILLSLFLVRIIQNHIRFNFTRFILFFKDASKGKARIDLDKINYLEFKELAVLANKMVKQREMAESGFKQMVEVFPYPICIYKNNVISYLNPQWIKIVGYEIFEIPTISRALIKCFPDMYERNLLHNLKNGDSLSPSRNDYLYKVLCKDGQLRYMKLNYIEMQDQNSMLTMEDYTYRKKVEDDLNKARIKAEESDSLKSAFLANMSHEIRTPMNAIIGFSSLLQNDSLPEEKQKKYLRYISNSSESLLNLLNDILDISKIEAGQLNLHITRGKLEDTLILVDAEIKSILNTLNKNEIQIIQKFDHNGTVSIETDFVRLKQILMNLLSNALKFTHSGYIEYGCRLVNSSKIQFYVKDSGIGIKENHLKLIFNRFIKIEDDHTHLFRGAGLGLAITKKLLTALNGDIWVESEYGKGSTFYFTIPVKQTAEEKQILEL